MAASKDKDVIYIDIDDEITGIIDKVRASEGKIIALVLPKRATVFQSIVNMKLLKKAAAEDKKRMVLITSEAGLLPLAGAVGLHVAKSLQSKPEVPSAPVLDDSEETVEETALPAEAATADTAGNRPIGELAGASALAAAPLKTDDAMETLELDNDEVPAAAPSAAPLPMAAKAAKDKKLRIPNFNRFRLWLAFGLLLLLVGAGLLIAAMKVLPKAVIDIKTNASNVNTNLNLTMDTAAKQLDPATNTVPAKQVTEQKTYTQTAPASGQKNNGNKASGTVTMTATECNVSSPQDVPAGTGVSANGLTFITQDDTSFTYNTIKNGCIYFTATNPTTLIAQSGGSQYNIGADSKFAIAGRTDVSASNSSDFSGGTDDIVKVVSRSDIDGAKAKITTQDSSAKQDLQNQLQQAGDYAVTATFSPGTPTVTTSANAGDAADNVTVTEVVTYTMLGAQRSDLKNLIDSQISSQIDTSKQSILNDGLDAAKVSLNNSTATTAQLNLQTTGVVGPVLSVASIKSQAAGKKSGDVQAALKTNPGITDVTIKLSPFWVTSVPTNQSKITVNIAKPSNTLNANNP